MLFHNDPNEFVGEICRLKRDEDDLSSAISSPALRKPSRRCSHNSGSNHFFSSLSAVAQKSGLSLSKSRTALPAVSLSPSSPAVAAIPACIPQWPGKFALRIKLRALR